MIQIVEMIGQSTMKTVIAINQLMNQAQVLQIQAQVLQIQAPVLQIQAPVLQIQALVLILTLALINQSQKT